MPVSDEARERTAALLRRRCALLLGGCLVVLV
jgi:hypothetical protein